MYRITIKTNDGTIQNLMINNRMAAERIFDNLVRYCTNDCSIDLSDITNDTLIDSFQDI